MEKNNNMKPSFELLSFNLMKDVKDQITEPIPESVIQERDAGKNQTLSYIGGCTVTDMLNRIFGYNWDWIVDKEWIEESYKFFNQYSKVPESEKVINPSTGKMGVWEIPAPVAHVRGRLIVHLMAKMSNPDGTFTYQERTITKSGYGAKCIIGKQNEQKDIFKSAGTDALKKAASLLGIGLELYRNEEQMDYFNELNYENPWTEDMLSKKAEQLAFLKKYREDNKISQEDVLEYVYKLTGDEDIVPDNIDQVVDALKASMKTDAKSSKKKAPAKKPDSKEDTVWTDEAKKEKAEELQWIKEYMELNQVTQKEMSDYISELTDGEELNPDNIDTVIEALASDE